MKKLLQSLGQDPNSEEKLKDAQVLSKFFAFKVQNDFDEDNDDDEADSFLGGGEVFDDDEHGARWAKFGFGAVFEH